jgi:hypothetical protein
MKKPKKSPVKKARKRTTVKEDAGKYLLDMSKLIFGSIVVSEILRRQIRWIDEDLSHDILLLAGIAAAIIAFIVGLIMGKREVKTEETRFHWGKRGKKRSKR